LPPFWRASGGNGGKSRLTPFTLERLYALVEGASAGRHALILTSNHPPEAYARRLPEVGEAVLSRLQGGMAVEVRGPDWRARGPEGP
jgi:DNA replication protein DnaC